ncbi:MAG: Transcriptional regulator of a riboflavin/FAD biosynthetic operon (rfk) [Candidatus Bathyarchaeota archaeon B63]|nr:MAG: Transcriptional regulator of a riboflavin/FAD biosynthetic operon (rfk) [Candidatus Bathyarchaeota archaeon B63]
MRSLEITKDLRSYFFILYKLAELGARDRTVKLSTGFIAEKLNLSQQTVSRQLIELERKGWIRRTAAREGSLIRLTEAGEAQLRAVHSALDALFEEKRPISIMIEGVVFSGLGEGAYYITRKRYREQFIEKLGFDPYPGTLNLKLVSEYDIQMRRELDARPGVDIEGFRDENRTYGPVKCFPARINGREDGEVVLALRTHYNSSVIEIISPHYLRGALKLKDGNKVKVEVFLREI